MLLLMVMGVMETKVRQGIVVIRGSANDGDTYAHLTASIV